METAQATCGLSEDPCSHKDTWWWNEEVAAAVREKKKKYGHWKKKNLQRYGRSTRTAKQMQRRLFS